MSLSLEWRHRIMAWRNELTKHLIQPMDTIPLEAAFTKEQYCVDNILSALSFAPITPGTAWGSKWEYGWFQGMFTLPEAAQGEMIVLMMDVGGEAAVYIDGDYAGAVDKEHKSILITDAGKPDRTYHVLVEAYAGHGPQEWRTGPTPPDRETVPEPPDQQCTVGESKFAIWQEVVFQLALDVETLWEVRENIDHDSLRVMEIDNGLKDFTLIADFEVPRDEMLTSLGKARERLKPLLEKKNGHTTPEMIGFGNAHIDVAWLWPLAETERKCVRTFSTQLALMEQYPEYKFFQSQPQLYVMVRKKYPDLYPKILAAVERGQWLPDGAAWVEPDTNLTSGESLIRQMVHGKRFFRDTFGVDCELLWLPDVFGYSGALPQIMRGCGVQYFSTQKIFWAYHGGEPFPYNTFIWEGIDGTQVKAHFHNDYTSEVKPGVVIKRWNERVQKDGFSMRLFPFGFGDGGGGPTREHLEYARRLGDLEGVPKFRIDDPMAFFKAQDEAGWPDARYVGELYFQVHRGTYTSQARTKALNRRCEFALRETELWGAAAMLMKGFQFPYEQWKAAWKTVLLNQFHDILPGSSIARVHEEAQAQLAEVVATAAEITREACGSLVENSDGLTVFNSLSWPRDELIELPIGWDGSQTLDGAPLPLQKDQGKSFSEVTVPACGWVSVDPGEGVVPKNSLKAQPNLLENDLVRVTFNNYGAITSIYDKVNQCELSRGICNQLRMYQDIPSAFDAWDLDSMYRQTPVELTEEAEIKILAEGPLFARLVVKRKLNQSTMTQTITLCRDARRVDFHTVVDWQERHKLLKVNFPVDYHANEALHEIQFGHLPRPTHTSRQIDRDRFEVPNQKWTALVEANRGFAVLNDSKYGVDVMDNSINLTLLKSALAPDMHADRGRQEFTYAFYYWDTPFMESGLVQQGYQLNVPLQVCDGKAGEQSLFALDAPNIILDTVKPAEDGSERDLILRFYEAMGTKTQVRLKTYLPVSAASRTDMLEAVLEPLEVVDGQLLLEFRPFEIKTLRLTIEKI
jgi:alpha-mannosidase